MTQSIQKNLEQLFEKLVPLAKEFNKNSYKELFMNEYNKYEPMFEEIIQECNRAGDKEAVIRQIAAILPEKMDTLLEKQGSRHKKEKVLINYNLGMTAFVIPMFCNRRSEVCEEIVDTMIQLWNDNGLSMDIHKSTFEEIHSGFKSHICYITTAVCEGLGKQDDCYELNLLREYRDGYLTSQSGGKDLIQQYYDVAPTIVKRINRQENALEVYQEIWNQYLQPCVEFIETGKEEECREMYSDMVYFLRKKYIYS